MNLIISLVLFHSIRWKILVIWVLKNEVFMSFSKQYKKSMRHICYSLYFRVTLRIIRMWYCKLSFPKRKKKGCKNRFGKWLIYKDILVHNLVETPTGPLPQARSFSISLYAKEVFDLLNYLRYLFVIKKGDVHFLPPTEDAF